MRGLAEDFYGFYLASAANKVLQLKGELRIELSIGKHRRLVPRLRACRPGGLGLMSGPATTNEKPVLYLELRRKGEPVNPLPWLASGDRKVSG